VMLPTTPKVSPFSGWPSCPACLQQVTKGRHGQAHQALQVVESKEFRGAKTGGWEETTYQCSTCGSTIEYTNDRNEFAPFWYFVEARP
jgi:endogenous inhibitor of DNA gyrase (YacG/DUF329 family)